MTCGTNFGRSHPDERQNTSPTTQGCPIIADDGPAESRPRSEAHERQEGTEDKAMRDPNRKKINPLDYPEEDRKFVMWLDAAAECAELLGWPLEGYVNLKFDRPNMPEDWTPKPDSKANDFGIIGEDWELLAKWCGTTDRSLRRWRRKYPDFPDDFNPASVMEFMKEKHLGCFMYSLNSPAVPLWWEYNFRGAGVPPWSND